MEYVEAPNSPPSEEKLVNLFLAGGITGCPDWQSQVVDAVKDLPVRVYNPRRKTFDANPTDEKAAQTQIEWEFQALSRCDMVVFWFPKESICPISLYELGRLNTMHDTKTILIGTHKEYSRRVDVALQTYYATDGTACVCSDFDALLRALKLRITASDRPTAFEEYRPLLADILATNNQQRLKALADGYMTRYKRLSDESRYSHKEERALSSFFIECDCYVPDDDDTWKIEEGAERMFINSAQLIEAAGKTLDVLLSVFLS